MRILLSIKAVLNYLYNHLIDLIWTKKVRFQDGTELTTANIGGGKLFDIKYLSQAIADKGWAFMCHTTTRNLSKDVVPTLYADIKNKYDNCDKGASSIQSKNNITAIAYDNGYFYFQEYNDADNWSIKKSANVDLSDSETINITFPDFEYDNYVKHIFVLENYFIFVTIGTRTVTYVFDKNFNYVTQLSRDFNICRKVNDDVCFAWHDFGIWKFNGTTGQFETVVQQVLEDENFRYYPFSANETFTLFFCSWDNRMSSNGFNAYASLVNGQLHFGWAEIDSRYKSDIITVGYDNIFAVPDGSEWGRNEFLRFYKLKYNSENNEYNAILYSTMTVTDHPFADPTIPCQIIKDNGIYHIVTNYSLITTSDFSNYSEIAYTLPNFYGYGNTYGFIDSDNFFVLTQGTGNPTMNEYVYSGLLKSVLTDTYVIDNASVTVDYYKFNDFKICVSDDGGTNDTNIKTVFDCLGYSNYWILDLTNETITIQRNKQAFVMMYVGDNFIDDLSDLPTNITRPLPQDEEITDSSASVSLDVLPNKNYKFTNNAITDITLNSCQDSPIETTITFSTGNSAPTLTDNSGITWVDGTTPILNANSNYIILIWNKIGFIREY